MSLNITVLGVGGGGCNCINRILESKIFVEFKNIEFCIADTVTLLTENYEIRYRHRRYEHRIWPVR